MFEEYEPEYQDYEDNYSEEQEDEEDELSELEFEEEEEQDDIEYKASFKDLERVNFKGTVGGSLRKASRIAKSAIDHAREAIIQQLDGMGIKRETREDIADSLVKLDIGRKHIPTLACAAVYVYRTNGEPKGFAKFAAEEIPKRQGKGEAFGEFDLLNYVLFLKGKIE